MNFLKDNFLYHINLSSCNDLRSEVSGTGAVTTLLLPGSYLQVHSIMPPPKATMAPIKFPTARLHGQCGPASQRMIRIPLGQSGVVKEFAMLLRMTHHLKLKTELFLESSTKCFS